MIYNLHLSIVILLGVIALVVLVLAANQAVKKLIGIAAYFHLSSAFIGMTVVSVSTSIPEITAHITASAKILWHGLDYKIGSAIVLGSNIGSDVVQQTLILGLVVYLAGGLYFRRYFLWKSMGPMIATSALCLVLGLNGSYSRWDGLLLLGMFILYNLFLFYDERKYFNKEDNQIEDEETAKSVPQTKRQVIKDSLVSILMLVVTVFAASIVLQMTEIFVERTAVSGSLIGVITLGIASALPELVTAIAGIRKKEHGISLGTLIGSNITNPLLGIGSGALISTYAVPRPLMMWDLPWAIGSGVILWAVLWFKKGKMGKSDAAYLIVFYFAYILLRVYLFKADY